MTTYGIDRSGTSDAATVGEGLFSLVRLVDNAGAGDIGFRITLQAPDISASYTLTLPVDDGTANQFLQTDGAGALAWTSLTTGDPATQYALLAGRAGGQTLTGGTAASEDLTLRPTSHATKGDVIIADEGGNVIIGGGATASRLRLLEASGSGTNYTEFVTQAQAGNLTYTLPAADGAGYMRSDGAGGLSWDTTIYEPGGTDVALADGGTGASLADPGADRILFWDESINAVDWLIAGSGLTITDKTITSTGGGFTLGTKQASTSGVAITFTGIPAGTKVIIITLIGVSTNGTGALWLRLGDAGGIEDTTYLGAVGGTDGTGVTTTNNSVSFILKTVMTAARTVHAQIHLMLEDSSDFTWSVSSQIAQHEAGSMEMCVGSKALSAELTQVSILNASGDAFDAGEINIAYS